MSAGRCFLGLPAPAKLNLFLHVLGRRHDGYHDLQSVFVPTSLCDLLDVEERDDGALVRTGDLTGPLEGDLVLRAARHLQAHARALGREVGGASLHVAKRIPVGAGLGGGSSDAATTLIALNRLWSLGLDRQRLAALGLALGADVPFFLGAGPAFVAGIGERCSPCAVPEFSYVIVFPGVHVATAQVFGDPKLTRDTKGTTIEGFSAAAEAIEPWRYGANDLEAVVRSRFPPVDDAFKILQVHGAPRMSGSGSAVFCGFRETAQAQRCLEGVQAAMPSGWSAWLVEGLTGLPLADW